jgi:hypothetical protein
MLKFLLNLLLQISKALLNSKIQFLIQEFLFLIFGPTDLAAHLASGPASRWPRCPRRPKPPRPTHLPRASVASSQEYVFPFGSCLSSWPPLPHLSIKRAPTVSSISHLQPPELARAAPAFRPPSAAQLRASGATEPLPPRLHFPSLNSPLKPSRIFNGVKAINAGVNPLATTPRRSPHPYKRRAPPPEFTAPLPASLHFSPRSSLPLTERRHVRFCTTVARLPRRRPSPGEALAELPVHSSLCCAPTGELWCTGVPPRPGPPSVRAVVGPRWTERARPVHDFIR